MLPDSVASGKSAFAHLDWTTVKKMPVKAPSDVRLDNRIKLKKL